MIAISLPESVAGRGKGTTPSEPGSVLNLSQPSVFHPSCNDFPSLNLLCKVLEALGVHMELIVANDNTVPVLCE